VRFFLASTRISALGECPHLAKCGHKASTGETRQSSGGRRVLQGEHGESNVLRFVGTYEGELL